MRTTFNFMHSHLTKVSTLISVEGGEAFSQSPNDEIPYICYLCSPQ